MFDLVRARPTAWLYAPDEGAGGGEGAGDGAQGGQSDQGGTGGGETGPAAEQTFTQAQVDAVAARTRRAVLADIGDVSELRRKATAFDEAEAAGATELDKANARVTAAEARAADVETRAKGLLRRAAVMTGARDTVDPEAVFEALANDDSITVADDGAVTGVGEAIAALIERRPYLKAAASGGAGNGGNDGANGAGSNGTGGKFDGGARSGGGDQLTRTALSTMTPAEIAKLTPEQVGDAMGRP